MCYAALMTFSPFGIGIAIVAVVVLLLAAWVLRFTTLWVRAVIANAPVSMGKLIGMRLRNVPAALIVDTRIAAVKAGIEIPSDLLEAHFLAGGNVENTVQRAGGGEQGGHRTGL